MGFFDWLGKPFNPAEQDIPAEQNGATGQNINPIQHITAQNARANTAGYQEKAQAEQSVYRDARNNFNPGSAELGPLTPEYANMPYAPKEEPGFWGQGAALVGEATQDIGDWFSGNKGPFGEETTSYLENRFTKMGIPKDQWESAINNLYNYSQTVRGIESDNNPMAAAGATSAKGVYQFVDGSVPVAGQRLQNTGYQNRENIDSIMRTNPHDWTDDQADLMFYGNMFAQTGSDDALKNIMDGSDFGKQAYYDYHHTKPDSATKTRATEFFK